MAFNSREYEWADITVISAGKDLLGIRGVKYTRKIEREAIFGKGRKAKAIQSGNESIEGELVLLQSTYNQLLDSSKGDLLSLSIDTEITFGNPSKGDAMRTDRLIGMRFSEESLEMKQGDKFAEITLPFLALDVQKNV